MKKKEPLIIEMKEIREGGKEKNTDKRCYEEQGRKEGLSPKY